MSRNDSITLVTSIFDIGRDKLEDFGRPFSFYIDNLCNLLKLDFNFVIFTDNETKNLIKERAKTGKNVVFVEKTAEKLFSDNIDIFSRLENIRKDEEWKSQVDWLSKSPQANLKFYNPVVMSKIFQLHDASIYNFFNNKWVFWIDSGINSTVSNEYLNQIIELPNIIKDKFLFISFPYNTKSKEVHGFDRKILEEYAQEAISHVCRGGFFGGHKDIISKVNSEYYDLLNNMSNEATLGTEECIFSILPLLNKEDYIVAEINEDGLIYKFFDDIKNNSIKFRNKITKVEEKLENKKTALYILTFECPDQLAKTLVSFNNSYEFLTEPTKIVIDNTEDIFIAEKNKRLAQLYECEYIKTDKNLGVCGGRQFIAEHFHNSDFDYYFFFEDDMTISGSYNTDNFGFPKYVNNLYKQCHEILVKEDLDFLKISFEEFYSSHATNIAFMNIDNKTREKYYPDRKKAITNLPPTSFTKIAKNEKNGLTYALGEDIYYSNWPCLFSKSGNRKLFIDEKIDNPHEQIWMAKNFKLQKEGKMKVGVLLSSCITHCRITFYEAKKRKES